MKFNWFESFSIQNILNYEGDDLSAYLRQQLTHLFLVIFTVLASFAVTASVLRSLDSGWKPLYTVHLIMLTLLWVAVIWRRKIPSSVSASLLISILLLAGIGGYLQFGLVIQNAYLFELVILFAVLMLPTKGMITTTIITIVVFITINLLFYFRLLNSEIDIIAYTHAPTTTVLKIVGFVFLVGTLFIFVSWIIKTLVSVVQSLEQKTQELEHSKEEIERIADVKAGFLANMSHEIRTPLNGILGFINQLHKTDLQPTQKEYIDIIHNNSYHLLGVINDILDLSKIDNGKVEIHHATAQIKKELYSTYQLYLAQAKEKEITLTLQSNIPQNTVVDIDILRLKQIISNLLNNAIKFTPPKGTIVLSMHQDEKQNDLFYFAVKDSGIGINKEAQITIFDPFIQSRLDTSKEYGGSGLGLSISYKLVELMGGTLKLDSEPEKGSCFYFSLRLKRPSSDDKALSPSLNSEKRLPLKILLAEDNKTNQLLMQLLLKEHHEEHQLTIAVDGSEAFDAFQKDHFDLILMDIKMPIMDGIQATQKIRALEKKQHRKATPIIALTANAFKEDQQRYKEIGMNGFLAKPVEQERLFDLLTSIPHAF